MRLLGLTTKTLIALRRAEIALYILDEEWAVIIGITNLLETCQHAAQTLVRYMLYQICTQLPPNHELLVLLDSDESNPMNSRLFRPFTRGTTDVHTNMLQVYRNLVNEHPPLVLVGVGVATFIAGTVNWIPAWICVGFGLSCSRGCMYDCRSPDPSSFHDIVHILIPLFLISRLLCFNYRVLQTVSSILTHLIILLYASVLVYFTPCQCGRSKWMLNALHIHTLNPSAIAYARVVMSWSVVFLLWRGVVSELLDNVSMCSTLDVFTAHLISFNAVTIANRTCFHSEETLEAKIFLEAENDR
jgi:hypothetical protein